MEAAASPMPAIQPSADRCGVCYAPLGGVFCAACGERRAGAHDYHLGALVGDAVRDFTSVDGRILRSARSLLTTPGDLTAAYFDGRRGRYTKPLSLFVVLNLLFFFVVPHTGLMRENFFRYANDGDATHAHALARDIAASGVPRAVYAERFDANVAAYKQSVLLYLIPLFAVAVMLTNVTSREGRRRFAVEHVIFSIHTVTFFLVASLALLLPTMFSLLVFFEGLATITPVGHTLSRALDSDIATPIVFCSVVAWYLKHASVRYYGDSPAIATLRSAVLTVAFFGIIEAFEKALFWAALWRT